MVYKRARWWVGYSALFYVRCGLGNPHTCTVADCERIARKYAGDLAEFRRGSGASRVGGLSAADVCYGR